MDINKIHNYSDHHTSALDRILSSTFVEAVPSDDAKQEKCDSQTDALFAIRQDPAVMDARVNVGNNVELNDGSEYVNTKVSSEKEKEPKNALNFEDMVRSECASLLCLSPDHLSLLMKFVATLRAQRLSLQKQLECAFCKKNGHPRLWYTMHALKDRKGRVRCPILRTYICRQCGATGNNAHTIKYCPQNK